MIIGLMMRLTMATMMMTVALILVKRTGAEAFSISSIC